MDKYHTWNKKVNGQPLKEDADDADNNNNSNYSFYSNINTTNKTLIVKYIFNKKKKNHQNPKMKGVSIRISVSCRVHVVSR